MKQFRAVWEVFVSEPERLSRFMEIKTKRRLAFSRRTPLFFSRQSGVRYTLQFTSQ
jgi:hypothetical protein